MNHWRAFDKRFFIRHQDKILFVLNAPILSVLFRHIFRIYEKRKIAGILPNAYFTVDGNRVTADFRTHWKYSKRLYYAFRPLWWVMHTWDWAFADRWVPELSFGFATLTKYPDADPESTSVDAKINHIYAAGSGVTWATIVAAGGTEATPSDPSGDILNIQSDTGTGNWKRLTRGIFLFDTSSLTSGANISSAVMSLYGWYKADGLGVTPNLDIYTSTPASNTDIVAGDFDAIGSTSQTGSPVTWANLNAAGYTDFTFDATGRGNVSKTSISKFGARNANYDVAATPPSWSSNHETDLAIYFADQSGTSNDPKLVVTYTLPTASWVPTGRLIFESVGS